MWAFITHKLAHASTLHEFGMYKHCFDAWLKLAGEGRPVALAQANATLSRVDLICEVCHIQPFVPAFLTFFWTKGARSPQLQLRSRKFYNHVETQLHTPEPVQPRKHVTTYSVFSDDTAKSKAYSTQTYHYGNTTEPSQRERTTPQLPYTSLRERRPPFVHPIPSILVTGPHPLLLWKI
jgi:hypothetical protein